MRPLKPLRKTEVVEISQQFRAGQEALFRAWTDPQALKTWFGPGAVGAHSVEVDLRVGGQYRMEMLEPNGGITVLRGIYRSVVVPERLVFTWILEDQPLDGADLETLVSVEFRAITKGLTEIYLRHEGLPSQESRDGHAVGWRGCLDGLRGNVDGANSDNGQTAL